MKKKKVCILQNGLARGGTDTFVVNLCKAINKDKFELTVVNPSNKPESQVREPDVLETGAKIVHTHPLTSWWGKLKHFILLYLFLRKEKFDVFQTNIDLFNGPNLLIAWLARVPIRCCHSHNGMQQKELTNGNSIQLQVYQKVMRWMCWTFSNRRTGCSQIAIDFLFPDKDLCNEKYPIIIRNGILIDKFRRSINIDKKKKDLGISSPYCIITVGRIIPQKNPLFIASMISCLLKMRGDCDFIWVGTGDMEIQCKHIFQSKGVQNRVHFLGQRDDINELLLCCNYFIMPSLFEGLPYVLVEAQAAGLTCLISDKIDPAVNCGGCLFLPLEKGEIEWANIISDLLDKNFYLQINEADIQQYSIYNLASQMEKVFNP